MSATEQEIFWRGAFGDSYADRNRGVAWISSNVSFFAKALAKSGKIESVLELGANIGLNLIALRTLLPIAKLSAVEINEKAAVELRNNLPTVDVQNISLFDFDPKHATWDLVFSKGVLIHVDPTRLSQAYDKLYRCSSRYIIVAEYYSPHPVEVDYRGHAGKLFKRDFAGEMLDRFPDLALVDYGFIYHRDKAFPQDDINWFLIEKSVND